MVLQDTFLSGQKSLCRWCLTKDAKYSSYFRILSVLSFCNVVQIVFRGKTDVLLFIAMFAYQKVLEFFSD